MLKRDNMVTFRLINICRTLHKQLVEENSQEKFDERRVNLLKSQIIHLERQVSCKFLNIAMFFFLLYVSLTLYVYNGRHCFGPFLLPLLLLVLQQIGFCVITPEEFEETK